MTSKPFFFARRTDDRTHYRADSEPVLDFDEGLRDPPLAVRFDLDRRISDHGAGASKWSRPEFERFPMPGCAAFRVRLATESLWRMLLFR